MKFGLTLIVTSLLLIAGFAVAQKPTDSVPQRPADTAPAKGAMDAKLIALQKPFYPLDVCPISQEKLGGMGEPVDMLVDGKLVRLCCGGCKKGVVKDKVAILKSIDEAVIAKQSVGYPMERCPISGEKMDSPVNHVVGMRLVRFCCNDCVKAFESDPTKSAAAMAKLDNAWIHSQKGKYNALNCPVSGNVLNDKSIDHLHGTRLVRLCCNDCVKELNAKPAVVLAKLDEMMKNSPPMAPKAEDKEKREKKDGETKGN